MNSVLFICSDYYSNVDANGVCIRNIVSALKDTGSKIYIICESNMDGNISDNRNISVVGVSKPWLKMIQESYKNRFVLASARAVHAIISLFTYPNVSPIRSYKILRTAVDLIERYNIDKVVCVYRPFESIHAGFKLKKKLKKLKIISYHLDLLTNPNSSNSIVCNFKIKKAKKILRKEKEAFDCIILPNSIKGQIESDAKIKYVDFPLSTKMKPILSNGFCFDHKYINIVYIGSIDGKNREIDYFNDLVSYINNTSEVQIMIHIWGQISPTVLMKIQSIKHISYHGIVDNKYTPYLIKNADIVLNLSNVITYNMIPSKIFEMISLATPIINIIENEQDEAIKYFSKVDYCFNIYRDRFTLKESSEMLISFIKHNYHNREYNPVIFAESTPEYTADIISCV